MIDSQSDPVSGWDLEGGDLEGEIEIQGGKEMLYKLSGSKTV